MSLLVFNLVFPWASNAAYLARMSVGSRQIERKLEGSGRDENGLRRKTPCSKEKTWAYTMGASILGESKSGNVSPTFPTRKGAFFLVRSTSTFVRSQSLVFLNRLLSGDPGRVIVFRGPWNCCFVVNSAVY